MREKLISIIVPVYNAENFLQRTVESILNQTYHNLELILINDGSKDRSGEICENLANKDSRVRVFHAKNGGISKAQNKGLDEAKGAYITFCDNDDLYHPQYLEILCQALETTESDLAKGRWQHPGMSELESIKFKNYSFDKEKLTTFTGAFEKYQTVFPKTLRKLMKIEAYYLNEANWCKLYRRELFDNLRFIENRFAQDVALAGPLLTRVKKVVDVNEVLYYWVQHSQSVTHDLVNFKFLDDNVQAGRENFNLALSMNIPPYRMYYLMFGVKKAIKMLDEDHSEYMDEIKKNYIQKMPHRFKAIFLCRLRLIENFFYDRVYHSKN
ncbi:MAG: glycosyltransferase family 2 protein [Lactovum sp.]